MPDDRKHNIRPQNRAGPLQAEPVGEPRRWRRLPYVRSTSNDKQAWRQTLADDGEITHSKCPKCGSVIRFEHGNVLGCSRCSWTPSRQELDEIEAKDPAMIPDKEYMKKTESWSPTFDKNLKRVSGQDRRQRRFLSRISF